MRVEAGVCPGRSLASHEGTGDAGRDGVYTCIHCRALFYPIQDWEKNAEPAPPSRPGDEVEASVTADADLLFWLYRAADLDFGVCSEGKEELETWLVRFGAPASTQNRILRALTLLREQDRW